MKNKRNKTLRAGAALLVVLFIVAAITALSLGFLVRSDVELTCGDNMILKTQMDYLAESALEHAKGLLLNPQDVASEYWTGATGQQLIPGSDDYYDVNVVKLGELNYQITSTAYRVKGGEQVGRSSLTAQLRLDPCIAIRTGYQWTSEDGTTINGDVYVQGSNLKGDGDINGDAFAGGSISATDVEGHKYANIEDEDAPVSFPGLSTGDFQPQYYIGSNAYYCSWHSSGDLNDVTLGPTLGNPAGIYYFNSHLILRDNVVINGTVVVRYDLILLGRGNSITATKNFPALVVGNDIEVDDDAQLVIKGLAQIRGNIYHAGSHGASLNILGALFIRDFDINGFESSSDIINVTAVPNKAAIEVWPTAGNAFRWSPVGGAFFKSIQRL